MASDSIKPSIAPEPSVLVPTMPARSGIDSPSAGADVVSSGWSRRPGQAIQLLTVALVAWSVCVVYTLYINPEIRFFKQAANLKRAWGAKVARSYGPKVVFFGGSSCTFAVDPERLLEQHKLPAANLGLGAGMGLRVLTRFALDEVVRGDTLIMAMEPTILMDRMDDTMLGVQISYVLGHPEWLARGDPIVNSAGVPWVSSSLMLRPGGRHTFTLLGKLLSRKPLYRYHLSDFNAAGWQQTAVRNELTAWSGGSLPITADARHYLIQLRAWCDARGVRLAYALPWTYTDEQKAAELRRNNINFLKELATLVPVLRDPRLGVDTAKDDFADTVWHLNGEAARRRTDELASQIKSWRMWSVQELASLEENSR
jgi:hypothetical protein